MRGLGPIFVQGLFWLLVVQIVTTLLSYALLIPTRGSKASRVVSLGLLVVGYHVSVWLLLPMQTVRVMDIFFFWLHLGYVFRALSSIYTLGRNPNHLPQFAFHFSLVLFGPWQHYGALGWHDLRGRRLDGKLLAEWGRHLGGQLTMAALAFVAIIAMARWFTPALLPFYVGAFAIIGIEILSFLGDLEFMTWSPAGRFQGFFGDFPFFKSKHAGQFWQRWNRNAIRAFRELTTFLNLRRRVFANTMVVFLVSGVLHQITVMYYTRRASFGTLMAFVLNGLLVYGSTALYHRRDRIPGLLRVLIFNPVTTGILVLTASQPLILDFYGSFVFVSAVTP